MENQINFWSTKNIIKTRTVPKQSKQNLEKKKDFFVFGQSPMTKKCQYLYHFYTNKVVAFSSTNRICYFQLVEWVKYEYGFSVRSETEGRASLSLRPSSFLLRSGIGLTKMKKKFWRPRLDSIKSDTFFTPWNMR